MYFSLLLEHPRLSKEGVPEVTHIGSVDSEDGTLLLGDAAILQFWQGSQAEHEHSKTIVDSLRKAQYGLSIQVEQHAVIVWNIEGPGTVDVFSPTDDSICLLRAWLSSDDEAAELHSLYSLPVSAHEVLGEIAIESGYLAMIWSAEDGSCIHASPEGLYSLDTRAMMTKTSGLTVALSNGIYRCIADEVRTDRAEARRCHLFKIR